MMWIKKKKNLLVVTVCMIVSFILYQLYFFSTITSEAGLSDRVIPVTDHHEIARLKELAQEKVVVRSNFDKFINNNGAIRGVLQMFMSKYRPDRNNNFQCLKSEQKIPFEFLNDDYCDCEDGTDEPSTNACVYGNFFCDTQYGMKPVSFLTVPSSQVNDGICDCCDGSDEWLNDHKQLLSQDMGFKGRSYVTKCPNKC